MSVPLILGPLCSQKEVDSKIASDTTDTKSRIGDEYILVRKQPLRTASAVPSNQKEPLMDVKSLASAAIPKTLRPVAGFGRGLGMKTQRYFMWQNGNFSTDGSGICAAKVSLDVSALSEFSPLAALFDEYRIVGGKFTYVVGAVLANTTTNLPLIGVVGYDPADGVTPSANTDVCQLAQHQMFGKPTQPSGSIAFTPAKERVFNWKVPPGTFSASTAPVALGTADWQSTAISTFVPRPAGYLVVYTTGTVSVTGLSGIIQFDVEFRSRT